MNVKREGLKKRLKKLLHERISSGENVIHENYDEEKRNMNYYFRDPNVGFKTHHIPNINMRNFYGKGLIT